MQELPEPIEPDKSGLWIFLHADGEVSSVHLHETETDIGQAFYVTGADAPWQEAMGPGYFIFFVG